LKQEVHEGDQQIQDLHETESSTRREFSLLSKMELRGTLALHRFFLSLRTGFCFQSSKSYILSRIEKKRTNIVDCDHLEAVVTIGKGLLMSNRLGVPDSFSDWLKLQEEIIFYNKRLTAIAKKSVTFHENFLRLYYLGEGIL